MRDLVVGPLKGEVLQAVHLEPFNWLVLLDDGSVLGICEASIIDVGVATRSSRVEHDGTQPRGEYECSAGHTWEDHLPHGPEWMDHCPECGRNVESVRTLKREETRTEVGK